MANDDHFEIFLATSPGMEAALADEARALRFRAVKAIAGGVSVQGNWRDTWRANLEVRGASRVLARLASFRALHLAQLDRRARSIDWAGVLRADVPVKVEATCRSSRIYHSGAAAERIATAIAEELGCPITTTAEVVVKARIEEDLVAIAVDSSGVLLHKRGHKEAVAKAPMRETLAALFLRQCGYDGTVPVLDPMCGSGTFTIEAAEIAAGLRPGRGRSFAFEQLVTFESEAWERLRSAPPRSIPGAGLGLVFHGSDRDAGAVRMSAANAERAGVAATTSFRQCAVAELERPPGRAGLVIANPPYGERIGDKRALIALYRTFGQALRSRFAGWRVGLITSDPVLAEATGLPFAPPGPIVDHGGIKIRLYQAGPLPGRS